MKTGPADVSGVLQGPPAALTSIMMQRLVHKADFERLLSMRAKTRSAHFAVHHVSGVPCTPQRPGSGLDNDKLSTSQSPLLPASVDNSTRWLGCVVPKRFAKRSVTRNMLKRQMRSVFQRHASALAPGLWLVRLHQGFPVAQFVSAKSKALVHAAQAELGALFARTSC